MFPRDRYYNQNQILTGEERELERFKDFVTRQGRDWTEWTEPISPLIDEYLRAVDIDYSTIRPTSYTVNTSQNKIRFSDSFLWKHFSLNGQEEWLVHPIVEPEPVSPEYVRLFL